MLGPGHARLQFTPLCNRADIALAAMRQNARAAEAVPADLWRDRAFALPAIKLTATALEHVVTAVDYILKYLLSLLDDF